MKFTIPIWLLAGLILLIGGCEQQNQFGSLEITSVPQGAAVFLDGMPTNKQTNCTLDSIEIGTHIIRLVLTGYKDYYDTVEVVGGKPTQVAATLSRAMGAIHIVSYPVGAAVSLDNNPTNKKTNCTLDSVFVGTHSIRLSLSGYADYLDEVIVREDQTTELSITLNPSFGAIHITSIPTGADIFLDNLATGEKTNTTINNVAAGIHSVKLSLAGYVDYTDEIAVAAGQTAELNVTLAKATGSIQVNSTPTAAQVYLDATNTNKITNCLLTRVEVGTHSIKLIKANYKEWEGNITVVENQTATINATLTPATGSIQVNSTPSGAAIWLDGVNTSYLTNYLVTNCTVGSRTVTLVKSGFHDWQTTVSVTEDQTTTVDAVLEKLDPWQVKSPMPTPRSNLACGVVNDKVYTIDGYSGFMVMAVAEEYDPATDDWSEKTPPPTARDGLGCAVVNNKIYAIGGEDEMMFPVATVEEYDPVSDFWQTKTPMPTPRLALACAVVNNKIYAIGGAEIDTFRMQPSAAVEEYDPATDTWKKRADMPTPRYGLTCAAVNGKIYAIGGLDEFYNPVSTVEVYDPATNTWQSKADMPTARGLPGSEVVSNKIYVIGGGSPYATLATVEEYDPSTNQWQHKNAMPTNRSGLACGAVNNKIYAIGGMSGGYEPLATVEEYDPTIDQ